MVPVIDPPQLAKAFARNTWILNAQADGLSHAESLLRGEHEVNCFNWVAGHIVDGRDIVFDWFQRPRLLTSEQSQRYARESDPITQDGPGVIPFAALMGMVDTSQEVLDDVLNSLDDAALAMEIEHYGRSGSLGSRLFFTYFHETFHTGQTELLRRFAGRRDQVI